MLGALAIVSGYLVFEYGRISAGYDVVEARDLRRGLRRQIDERDDEITRLKQEIAVLETHREIDREAYRVVEANLVDLQLWG